MLYNEVNAEKSFLTLINAAVSHELRNPLNSLVGQVASMMNFFQRFTNLINQISDVEIAQQLKEVYSSIHNCGKKMASATKFIDFFVHDILDYTILNQDSKNFIKNISVFNMSTAVDEIIECLADKVSMKNITVETSLVGFTDDDETQYLIKSDMKRI